MRLIIKFIPLLIIIAILSGCNLILVPAPDVTIPEEDLMQTAIYLVSQTAVVEQVTPSAQVEQTAIWAVTQTPEFTVTPTPTTEATLTPSSTLESTPIPTIERSPTRPQVTLTPSGWCNAIGQGPIFDITIPDGTEMLPGQTFTKIWRLINTGTCTWTRLYKLVFYSGNDMGSHQENLFGGEVQPGQMVDISIQLTAPLEPGIYQSNWMLMDGSGNLFGMGWNADAPFWANIYVVEELSPTPIP
ncbi:MAG: NBR1-Ig-like domain-containing protein [Anaerolineaceae bacterium]